MKQLDTGLAGHVADGVTTLARLWTATRRDGAVHGFTDHDRDLVFAGVPHLAASGLDRSETVAATGLGIGGGDVLGALSADSLTDDDLRAGQWDGARIEVRVVNWADPAEVLHQATFTLGEVTCRDGAFSAELRSVAQALDETRGRLYQHRCDADFGDARCGADAAGWQGTGIVTAAEDGRRLVVSGLGTFEAGLFAYGRLAFTSGANAGRAVEVKADVAEFGARIIDLWQPMAGPVAAGDTVTVTAGCDHRFETCRDRFANGLNFRGFPHIPGSDHALGNAATSTRHDGGALVP